MTLSQHLSYIVNVIPDLEANVKDSKVRMLLLKSCNYFWGVDRLLNKRLVSLETLDQNLCRKVEYFKQKPFFQCMFLNTTLYVALV